MLRNILTLIRWQNLVFIAIILYTMQYWVATPLIAKIEYAIAIPWWLLAMIMLATSCIAAGGYVINDYFDVKIDRINRPDELIVTRAISKDSAMLLFQCTTAAGVLLGLIAAWICRSYTLAAIFILVPGLLWFYSASYKRMLIVGNVIISFVSALVPLLVAIANTDYMGAKLQTNMSEQAVTYFLYLWIGGFGIFAFITTWIREIIKDMQDQMGDRELECHTMPVVWGNTATKVIVTVMMVLTALSLLAINYWCLPFRHVSSLSTRYILFGLIIPMGCCLALLWTAKIPSDYKNAQNLMKFIMFLGVLYSFVFLKMI